MATATDAAAASAAAGHKLPEVYRFPPFFTLQKCSATRETQCEMWHGVLEGYCGALRQWELSTTDKVFRNDAVSRRLSPEAARVVLDSLASVGKAVWQTVPADPPAPPRRTDTCYVFPQPLLNYANELYAKVDAEGQLGSVFTLYELVDTQAEGTSWVGMPQVSCWEFVFFFMFKK